MEISQDTISYVSFVLSKIIGYAIVSLSPLLKVPQILIILKNKKARGLLFIPSFLEAVLPTFQAGYFFHFGHPISTYGEQYIIAVESIFIMFLLTRYGERIPKVAGWLTVVTCIGIFSMFALDLVPEFVYSAFQVINLVAFAFSKTPTILKNFKAKNTGDQAFLTVFLSFAGNLARLFTIIVEVKSLLLIATYGTYVLLTGIQFTQFLMFWGAKLEDDKKKN